MQPRPEHVFDDPRGVHGRRDDPRPRREGAARGLERGRRAIHGHVRRLQFRDEQESCVRFGPDEIRPPGRRHSDEHRVLLRHIGEIRLERLLDFVYLHAHQHPQRVTRHVVRRLRRPAGIQAQVRILLGLEHRFRERAVRLRGLDHPGARRVLASAGGERRARGVDFDLAGAHDVEQLLGLERIALLPRNDERVRRGRAVHPVRLHFVKVLEPRGSVLRDVRHPGERDRVAVLDDLPQVPVVPPIRQRKIPARFLRAERSIADVRIGEVDAGDLAEDARLAVVDHVLARRRPQVVARVIFDAGLALRHERRRHREPDVDVLLREDRMDVRVVRIVERRHEDPRLHGPHLVHVVRDLRLVVVLDLDGEPRLLLREHEPVAVVVVAGVLVIQVRIHAVERRPLRLVPVVDDEHLAVGVLRRHDQDDKIVEDLSDVGAAIGREPVRDFGDRLRVADFRRVDRAVEEVKRASLLREPFRLRVRQPAGIREPPVDRDQPIEFRKVFRRADRRQHVRIAHRRLAELLEPDAIRRRGEVLEVLDDLRIARQLAVGADVETEELVGRLRGALLRASGRERAHERDADGGGAGET